MIPGLRTTGDYTLGPEAEEVGFGCPMCRHRLAVGHRVAFVWVAPGMASTVHYFCAHFERVAGAWAA